MDGERTVVLVAVRSEAERHFWLHPLLVTWLLSLTQEKQYGPIIEMVFGYNSLAASANACADVFLQKHKRADWLCIVDNDTVPPSDLLRILDTAPDEADIVAPVNFQSFNENAFPQAGFYGFERGQRTFASLSTASEPGLYAVDRVGGGCWFIRRRVFERLSTPYFKILFHPETYALVVSDDVWFQDRAKEAGCQIFCDTRYVASHYHTRDLSI